MPRTKMDTLAEQLNSEPEVTEVEAAKKVEEAAPAKKEKKKFEQTSPIMCRSVVIGGLFLEGSKTKNLYEWRSYGDEVEVEYRDLVSEVRAKSSAIFSPWLIVEDDDFVEEFPQLKQFYIDHYPVRELRDILDLPVKEMVKAIKDLPAGAKDTFRNLAAEAVASGQLDSVNKIKALDEIYDTDLNLLASLSE